MVEKIEAALAVCGHRSTDSSANFMDDLMHAWDTSHVPDQVLSNKSPRELVGDIFTVLDNLTRDLESINGEDLKGQLGLLVSCIILCAQVTCSTCHNLSLDAAQERSKTGLIRKIEMLTARISALKHERGSRANSVGQVCAVFVKYPHQSLLTRLCPNNNLAARHWPLRPQQQSILPSSQVLVWRLGNAMVVLGTSRSV